MPLIEELKKMKWRLRVSRQKKVILSCELKNQNSNKSFLERDMLLLAHSIEKGMGIPNPRKGYGKDKAYSLVCKLVEYTYKYGYNSFPFCESVAVLDKYIELLHSQNEDIGKITTLRESIKQENFIKEDNYCQAGSSLYTYEQLNSVNYEELRKIYDSRHSIRHFSKETINRDELLKVVSLANKAPSACNRQPIKLYYTENQRKAYEFERIIDGSHGFQGETPYYMAVTSNRAYFTDDEYLQWYTNGGIYLAFLTLAFHSMGIGSIILQWKYGQKNENTVKSFFGIERHEAIVALLGFGKYPVDGTKCIVAQRKSADETLVTVI